MAIPLLGVVGWTFIPHQATKQALKVLHYVLSTFRGIPTPPPGTFEYQRNYRYTFAVVVLGYLIYTMIDGSKSMLPNYYEILGVVPTADENALKLAFRQFAKKYHPDRVGPQGEALFITVRDAFEALKNPTVRFAYDRFGPDVLTWNHCSTIAEYLHHGLVQSMVYHIVAGAALVFWTAIGETSPVAFWRYVLYVSLFASELALLLSPSPSLMPSSKLLLGPLTHPSEGPSHRTILHVLFPGRVPYQHILFLHQLFLFMSIALSRVAPQFFPDASKITEAMTHRLLHMVGAADREASQLLHSELHCLQPSTEHVSLGRLRPVQPSSEVMDALSAEMEKMIIETAVKQEGGPFKSVWEAAVAKGKRLAATAALSLPKTPMKGYNWGTFPRSATSTPDKGMPNGSPSRSAALSPPISNGVVRASVNGAMPPPPPPGLDRPGYVRHRSASIV
ncbi:hypothetical protein C8R43DRAFT_187412 [Mycena crocata]|nr:hypothetical protein C8R43DRAFT_187412 [Mycena crocata]